MRAVSVFLTGVLGWEGFHLWSTSTVLPVGEVLWLLGVAALAGGCWALVLLLEGRNT